MHDHSKFEKRRAGFTLVELSIVLLIFSLMLGGILAAVTQDIRRKKQAELQMKLDTIEEALLNFRKLNTRLPCPADIDDAVTASTFGTEKATPGTCTGANYTYSLAPTGSLTVASLVVTGVSSTTGIYADSGIIGTSIAVGTTVASVDSGTQITLSKQSIPPQAFGASAFTIASLVGGVLPTKALGLPDEYMFDPWGGRFLYMVDLRMTGSSAFTTYTVGSSIGSIVVLDSASSPNTRYPRAVAAIISHGPNGHGAYQISGARKSSGSTNANEQENCDCNAAAAAGTFDNLIVLGRGTQSSGDVLTSFDDTVRYYTRGSFYSRSEELKEYIPNN